MKPNDILLINGILRKTVEHEKKLEESRKHFEKVAQQFEQVHQWQT